ncbi:SulP family inorganic anion transporter [Puia sp.]|jgi:MFS superfamily sulfate permease-like transporter|uniref:SulP family inorganic anion transporter n=1 Tax=Puia sp. TaxID=2045100 RepID=UPI002F40751C
MKKLSQHLGADIPSGLVVFLVALPLCLGVALASNAPLFAGIIAGIVGGLIIGSLSGSSLSVSGPAAGLTAIVAVAIGKMPAYEAFILSVVIAGVLQIVLGTLKAGILGDYVPNSVIRGMLAAIGLILIFKQLPHLLGYKVGFSPAAMGIGLVSVGILLLWDRPFFKKKKFFRFVPGPLMVVAVGIILSVALEQNGSAHTLAPHHLVNLPVAGDLGDFTAFFRLPDWHYLGRLDVWTTGLTIALVASLETLLCIEAIDKLDPYNRSTPTNRELKAQGIGNIVSGMLGGLPVTSVIVRSSANLDAGARTRMSTILHGSLLLLSVLLIPGLLNAIPLSALAAILVMTGYKLAKPTLFREFHRKGWDQFVPFVVTIVAILLTDLLIGIVIGIAFALFFLLRSNFHSAVMIVHDGNKYLLRFRKDVSFLNKPIVKQRLEGLPEDSFILIDMTRADFIDKDVLDVIDEFMHHAHLKNIRVEVRKNGQPVIQKKAA